MKTKAFTLLAILAISIWVAGCDSNDSTTPLESPPRVYLSPEELSISMGGTAPIELKLVGISDSVFAISLTLKFSTSVITYTHYATDDADVFGPDAIEFVQADSTLSLAFSRLNTQAAVIPNGRICTLEFTPVTRGSTTLTPARAFSL